MKSKSFLSINKIENNEKKPVPRKRIKRLIIADMILFVLILGLFIATEKPEKINSLAAEPESFDTVNLEWEQSAHADRYHIYRQEEDGKSEYIATAREPQYHDQKLVTGRKYSYSVYPCNGIRRGGKALCATASATPMLDTPKLSISTKEGEVTLSVSEVDGAIGYEISRNGKKLCDTKEPVYTDIQAEPGKEYTYAARAFRYKKEPVYSEYSKKKKASLISAGEINAEISGEDILFSWDGDEAYSEYALYDGKELLTETAGHEYRLESLDPEKKYDIRLIGTADDGSVSPESEKTFEIATEPMTNQEAREAACEWAANIAADDSFSYGTGERAHRCGCYFCGTNTGPVKNKKGKSLVKGHSYAKTYCCVTFVTAAYAHGAGDPAVLKLCQSGGTFQNYPKSYKGHGSWKNAGKPSYKNLQPGDILCKESHVALYIGDGKIAHAIGSGGWSSRGILVSNLSQKKYKAFELVMRYQGNGRGEKYVIKEIPQGKSITAAKEEQSDKHEKNS